MEIPGNALGIVFNKNVNFMTENYFGKAQGDVAGPPYFSLNNATVSAIAGLMGALSENTPETLVI